MNDIDEASLSAPSVSYNDAFTTDSSDGRICYKGLTHQLGVFALLRKRVPILGFRLYFLEDLKSARDHNNNPKDAPGRFGLYGGKVEANEAALTSEETPEKALVRELNEELGPGLVKPDGVRRSFDTAHFATFAAILGGGSTDVRRDKGIYRINLTPARGLSVGRIRAYQKKLPSLLQTKKSELARIPADQVDALAKMKDEVACIEAAMRTGRPVILAKVGPFWLRRYFPFVFGFFGDWAKLTPVAAYALHADARVLD